MFEHKKQLLQEVKVERPNPQYAVLMQEQLGGGNGELKAAMQYMSQSFRIKDPEIKGPLGKCGNSTLCDCIEKNAVKSFAKNLEEKIFHYLGVENIQQASELSLLDSLLPYDVVIDSIHEFLGECK